MALNLTIQPGEMFTAGKVSIRFVGWTGRRVRLAIDGAKDLEIHRVPRCPQCGGNRIRVAGSCEVYCDGCQAHWTHFSELLENIRTVKEAKNGQG